jgi:surfeit locus 1 family protein
MMTTHKVLRGKKRGWLEPTVFAIAGLAILISLGVWQLERKVWKENLIATLNERLSVPPVTGLPAPSEWSTLDPAQMEYKRVVVPVEFLHDQEALVYTPGSAFRPDVKTIGYWVLTPARLPGGSVIVVNRGFVPLDRKNPSSRQEGQLTGLIDITAVMRWPEERGLFTPADEPQNNIWFVRDP